MEEEKMDAELRETESYKPRPKWQVALAWVLLALMVLGTVSYYYWIAHVY